MCGALFIAELHLGNRDSVGRTDVKAGLTHDTLTPLDRIRLALLHLKNHQRTVIDTLFAAGAFVGINLDKIHNIHLLAASLYSETEFTQSIIILGCPSFSQRFGGYFCATTCISSISKIRVWFGPITCPAPRSP